MTKPFIKKETFDFLKRLAKNNDRKWFEKHRDEYVRATGDVERFMDGLISEMNKHDQIETPSGKRALYRIYNDVRFSKDKTPYNPRFAGYLRRTKPSLRGGYYIWLKPGSSRIGCGFAFPNAQDLLRLRQDIERNHEDWTVILQSKPVKKTFGIMTGEKVKTTPRGFPADHPAIDLLRYKAYWFQHSFSDKEVLDKAFVGRVSKAFRTIRPFFDYASDVLGTDLNGESL